MSVKHSFLSRGYVDSALWLYFWQHIAQKLPHMCKAWRLFSPERDVYEHVAIICWVIENTHGRKSTSKHFGFTVRPPRVLLCFSAEPMRTPKRLKIAETRARLIAVDWESLGYNITRCHTFNVTICYHYMTANNRSKADCLDMDPKGNTQFNY